MDPSNAQHHHQEMSSQTLESMLVCTKPQQDKKPRPPSSEQALKCPRCDSTNTKFCYYNNYSLTQPRYFCKSCRRYWTKGGTLRNVPVGGGCRKNKRSCSSSSSSAKRSQENQSMINISAPNPLVMSSLTPLSYDSSDLSLAFARLHQKQTSGHFGSIEDHQHHDMSMMCTNVGNSDVLETPNGFLDALRGGFLETTTPNGFHHNNLYYGINGNVENGGMGMNVSDQEMQGMHSYDQELSSGVTTPVATTTTTTTVKQEMCSLARENENRILWGFPWQMNGDVVNNGDFESSNRQSWNGLGGSSWHGLLNSPLM